MLRRDAIDGRAQLGAFVVQLPGRAWASELDVDASITAALHPRPEAIGQALQYRARLAQCLTFFIDGQGLLSQQNIVIRRWVAVNPEFVLAMVRQEIVAFDGCGAPRTQLLLDARQEFLGMRRQDDLFAIQQAIFEEDAPDAISVFIVNRVDDIIEDNYRAALGNILGKQDRLGPGI